MSIAEIFEVQKQIRPLSQRQEVEQHRQCCVINLNACVIARIETHGDDAATAVAVMWISNYSLGSSLSSLWSHVDQNFEKFPFVAF